ncbi:helix-turn-helix transcriptional regulator [Microbispora amethystogenes]|uniref:helix-turn-helix domain-containing protein n=1 Tax=Microbispora amethystogenes TaxID=1427754 RepID=UPI0033F48BB3
MSTEPRSDTASPQARFGAELRRLREAAGLSQAAVAARLGCTQTQVSRLEQALRTPQPEQAEILDQLFGLSDRSYFAGLYKRIVSHPGGPQWFMGWLDDIEPRATVLRSWDPLLIPGLLQTEAYARHLLTKEPRVTPEEVEERLRARLQRRSILDKSDPPLLLVLIDQGVLHRRIGTAEVMQEQLRYLLELAQRPNVTVQVVDPECVTGLLGAFMIAELPNGEPHTIHADSSAEGLVSASPELVSAVWTRYESIRAWAYPEHISHNMIKEVMAQWN